MSFSSKIKESEKGYLKNLCITCSVPDVSYILHTKTEMISNQMPAQNGYKNDS